MQYRSAYNFGVRGCSPTKLALDATLGWGVNASTKFGGTATLKIWENKKRPKFSMFYDNFRV